MHLLLRFCLACSFIVGCSARKPGTCPSFGPFGPAVCRMDCVSDYGCPGAQKCCSYGGCVNVCRTPTTSPRVFRFPLAVQRPLCDWVCVRAPCCPGDPNPYIA